MFSIRKWLLFSALVFKFTVTCASKDERLTLIEKVITSTDSLVTFFERFKNEANLDGIFGVRFAGDQLETLLAEIDRICSNDVSKINNITKSLKKLQMKATSVADAAIPIMKAQSPDYFDKMGFLLQKGFWKEIVRSQDTNASKVGPTSGDSLNETNSDECIIELAINNCQPSINCWKRMTSSNTINYYLTHELLYLQIGQRLGCKNNLNQLAKTYYGLTVNEMSKNYCSRILYEANQIYNTGFNYTQRDLFMEQMGLCGVDGFHEFFKPEWIQLIMQWQRPTGCYGHERIKREEKMMSDGCFSHTSAVAVLALQQSIRYLLNPILVPMCPNWIY